MANSKISGLTTATTPLAGTEKLVLLQTNDKQITVADFAAGAIKSNATTGVLQVVGPVAASTRVMTTPDANFSVARTDALQTLTGNQTITNGSVVLSDTYGIDFSATSQGSGTMTSELLDDYEEGTWTPIIIPAAGSITSQIGEGRYVKIGRAVIVEIYLKITDVGTATQVSEVTGLPFTAANTASGGSGLLRESGATGLGWSFTVNQTLTSITVTTVANNIAISTNYSWRGSITYSID
jgi:hypothetical protein